MPQTLLAAGNNPISLVTFASEKMLARRRLYFQDVANASPVNALLDSVGYGTNGVTAGNNAPATLPGASIISVLPTIGTAATRAAIQAYFGGFAGQLASAGGAGAAVVLASYAGDGGEPPIVPADSPPATVTNRLMPDGSVRTVRDGDPNDPLDPCAEEYYRKNTGLFVGAACCV